MALDLLRRALVGDRWAGALFQEFAEAFKGKRQLFWSAGLKDRYPVEDADDSTLAAQVDDSAVMLGAFSAHQWRCIVRAGIRGHLLLVAQAGDWSQVLHFVDGAVAVFGPELLAGAPRPCGAEPPL